MARNPDPDVPNEFPILAIYNMNQLHMNLRHDPEKLEPV
jgi:hypothetical protein